MSNIIPNPQPPEIIAALRAAGCGIRRGVRVVEPPPPKPEESPEDVIQRAPRVHMLATIRSVVALVCEVSVKELTSGLRRKKVCRARHMFFYTARELGGASFTAIGNACGGKDHATVMHGISKVADNSEAFEPELSRVLGYLKRK